MGIQPKNLGQILIDLGALTPERIPAIQHRITETTERFGEAGVALGFYDGPMLERALVAQGKDDLRRVEGSGSFPQRRKIGEILVETGDLTPAEVERILDRMTISAGRFGETAVREGFLGEDLVAQALARQFRLDYLDLEGFILDPELVASLPTGLPLRYQIVPVRRKREGLVVAVADPVEVGRLDELE